MRRVVHYSIPARPGGPGTLTFCCATPTFIHIRVNAVARCLVCLLDHNPQSAEAKLI